MYTSQDLAIRIKSVAKDKNKIIKDTLAELALGSNTTSALYHGKSIAFDSLARIAGLFVGIGQTNEKTAL